MSSRGSPPYLVSGSGLLVQLVGVVLHVLGHLVGWTEGLGAALARRVPVLGVNMGQSSRVSLMLPV